jgi:predicted regulator of Ras-like GTPase activity (Roadblock/LC7/MglB family)
MTRVTRLAALLEDFLDAAPNVEAAAVTTPDGWPVICALPEGLDESRLAAMSASVLVLAERISVELAKGEIGHVYVSGDQGQAILMPAGPDALFMVTTYPSAKIGLVLFEMRRSVRSIAAVMDSYRAVDELKVVVADERKGARVVDITEIDVNEPR